MDNTEEMDRRYRMLWQQAKRNLEAYASSARSETRKIYSKSFEGPLSQPKSGNSGQSRAEEVKYDEKDDTCMEYMIKVVSSTEKGEQMKQRRVRFKDNVREC